MTVATKTIPKGCKQTEIGVIPADWDVQPISHIAKITTGSKNTQDKVDTGLYPFFVRSQVIERINSYSYDGEAILTAGDGVGTGKVFHYINGKFDIHQRVYKISDFSNDIDGYYFYLYFSNNFYNRIMQMTAKSSVDSVRMEMIADMQIPLPGKTEQVLIAESLSNIDALIQKTESLIEKKKVIKQGTMQELLTGKRRLPGFDGEWEEKILGDVADFYKGKGLPKSDMVVGGKYKCIHYGELFTIYHEEIKNIFSFTNNNESLFFSKTNDVLMPTSDVTPNGLATASCVKENGVILGGDVMVIRSHKDQCDGVFIAYGIRQNRKQVMQLVSGSTVYHLYGSDMKKYKFYSPPTRQEQTAIAAILSDMDTEIEKLESELTKWRDMKQGMMQTLLTGKIRLIK